MPATSQLDWLISMTAMIVLFWSRATRDLLKSFGWGIAGTPSIRCTRRSCHYLAVRPIASLGPPLRSARCTRARATDPRRHRPGTPDPLDQDDLQLAAPAVAAVAVAGDLTVTTGRPAIRRSRPSRHAEAEGSRGFSELPLTLW